ncbi:MAG: long-chain fatty acid--CoA ligase [Bacteroidales bacterium]
MKCVKRIIDLLPHLRQLAPGKKDLFAHQVKGRWVKYSVDDYLRTSGALSQVFRSLGYQPGDRVLTIISNRPDWNFIDMGIMMAGLIHVPVYPTLSISTIGQIIRDCAPAMLIVEDPGLATDIQQFLEQENLSASLYAMHAATGLRHYNELLETGLKHYDCTIDEDDSLITPETTATIIYTSGTTGAPKGVMLSHSNIVSNFLAIAPISGFGAKHRAMSFLPLCHIYERTLNYMYQFLGMSIYYAAPIERAGELLRQIRPDVFCTVPRFLEKAWNRFLEAGDRKRWPSQAIFLEAVKLASNYEINGHNNLWYRFRLSLFRLLVFRKWKSRMGKNISIIVSGSAPLQPRLARGFWAAGIRVLEGYGLTETSPVIAVNRTGRRDHKIGTVGPLLEGVQVRISEEGEIICKGPNVMQGYWNNAALTAEVLDQEGWFHTGDIGSWDDDKFLRIIDRKKELIKTSGGKYISPQQIESLFCESPFFDQMMVIGEGRRFPAAIISPDFSHLMAWCQANNIQVTTPGEILSRKDVVRILYRETEKANARLGRFEMIKRFLFVTESWDASTGELSPTLKLRRKMLYERYRDAIEELYEDFE